MQVLWHALWFKKNIYFFDLEVYSNSSSVALQIPGLNKYSAGHCLRDHFWRVTKAYITSALGVYACRSHYRGALWGACVRWGSEKRAELINVSERRQIMKSLMWNGRWKACLCKWGKVDLHKLGWILGWYAPFTYSTLDKRSNKKIKLMYRFNICKV